MVPLLLREATTAGLQALLAEDHDMLVWWGTRIECTAAIARREREDRLDPKAANLAAQQLERFTKGWIEIQPADPLRAMAQRLLRVHALHAADALQLAAALSGVGHDPFVNEIVCLDQRLTHAAQREGLKVLA